MVTSRRMCAFGFSTPLWWAFTDTRAIWRSVMP